MVMEGIQTNLSLGTSASVICREAKERHPDYIVIALSRDVYGQPVYVAHGDDSRLVIDLCGARLVGFGERHAEIEHDAIQEKVKLLVEHGHKVMVIWGYAFFRANEEGKKC